MGEPTGNTENKVSRGGLGGRNVQLGEVAQAQLDPGIPTEFPTAIERADIRPGHIEIGGTELILQRHGKYERDTSLEKAGSLTPEAAAAERSAAEEYFRTLFAGMSEDERATVDIMFVASDTSYHGAGKRSYETALIAQEAARTVLGEYGLSEDQIINFSQGLWGEGAPRPMANLREPNMFSNSPDFVKFLQDKYGDLGLDFWVAFEEDTEREVREKMGAEGPDQIADRMAKSVRVLARYAENYHRNKPGRRLIIWAATHYDTISPFIKREVFGVGKEAQLLVDYGAGVTIDISPGGSATTELGEKTYQVPVKRETT